MERVYDRRRLHQAWQAVRRNAGAAGIDQMTVADFARREEEFLDLIQAKLQAGTYRFKPARRVEIPKPGSTKTRNLGIPVVMDRIVSHSLHSVLEELFEPDFTTSNYGFRRGKSQHQAIGHVRQAVVEGYEWCAAIDLQGFFDEIPHDLILKLIRRKIRDERVVTLIARALKAGVRVDGVLEKTVKGCPQGSPVSPVLSNIVLNELDHELQRRGHRYCRWADDFLILLKTERAARRVMESVTTFLEQSLGLPVNRDKSQVALVKDVEFLGFVRHEVAYMAVMTPKGGHNLVCCHQYPTQTCGWSNPAVWSSGDNVASSFGTAIKPRGEMATASIKAVRELGSDGMANTCELLLNVVRKYKPKMLRGLSQTGTVDR